MPPKTVTCSICSATVLKAQTLARADGTRACRSHEGVSAEAAKRQAAERERLDKAIESAGRPAWMSPAFTQAQLERQQLFEKEAAAFREHLYSHCWICGEEGLELREFFAQAMVAMKRLELRGEFNFLTMPLDVRKLMGNVRALGAIQLQEEVIDRAVVKHIRERRVRDLVQFTRVVLFCPACAQKHGFMARWEALFPKPTWEQIRCDGPRRGGDGARAEGVGGEEGGGVVTKNTSRTPKSTISTDTRKKIRQYLERVWKTPKNCPICGFTKWHIQEGAVVSPGEETIRGSFIPNTIGNSIPTFQVVCTTCNFFYNFLLLPVIEEKEGVMAVKDG